LSKDTAEKYASLVQSLAYLRGLQSDILSKYAPGASYEADNEKQIATLEDQRRSLEKQYPELVTSGTSGSSATPASHIAAPTLESEKTRLSEVGATVDSLTSQLAGLQKQFQQTSAAGMQITKLELEKEAEETNLKYLESSLDQAHMDQALNQNTIPNISTIQKPSPALKVLSSLKKTLLGLAGGGLAFGLAIALFIEMVVDRSVKRPLELEAQLHIPLLLSIPFIPRNIQTRLVLTNGNGAAKPGSAPKKSLARVPLAPWEHDHFIRTFAEAIRDRLILYFEINNMKHKPKLVAVTSYSDSEGTSTVAGGLAAALSETGDGKVLLVNMNEGNTEIHPFYAGKPSCSISEALEPGGGSNMALSAENLFLAVPSPANAEPNQFVPRKFYDMVPRFKASDFDYIIFDMPSLNESSATLAMAGFMDKVLFVIESGKSNRDLVKRAYLELVAAKADVVSVFNKNRSYGPKWLNGYN
jgi:Mrp family chromosome partitioning ATPase